MIEDTDYEKFYDLERYLFKDVTDFFQKNGYFGNFSFEKQR